VAAVIEKGAPPVNVIVEKRKTGYHTSRQTVRLLTDGTVKLSPLAQTHKGENELDWTIVQLLGLGFTTRGFNVPDWFFAYGAAYLWAQPPAAIASRAVIHTDLSMGLGTYLFLPPGAPVRLGIYGGFGFVLSAFTVSGFPLYTDFYLNAFSWWIETGFAKINFFVRQEYRYDLGIGQNLLGRGWIINNFPPTTIGVMLKW
jgi:hypothetical protein